MVLYLIVKLILIDPEGNSEHWNNQNNLTNQPPGQKHHPGEKAING